MCVGFFEDDCWILSGGFLRKDSFFLHDNRFFGKTGHVGPLDDCSEEGGHRPRVFSIRQWHLIGATHDMFTKNVVRVSGRRTLRRLTVTPALHRTRRTTPALLPAPNISSNANMVLVGINSRVGISISSTIRRSPSISSTLCSNRPPVRRTRRRSSITSSRCTNSSSMTAASDLHKHRISSGGSAPPNNTRKGTPEQSKLLRCRSRFRLLGRTRRPRDGRRSPPSAPKKSPRRSTENSWSANVTRAWAARSSASGSRRTGIWFSKKSQVGRKLCSCGPRSYVVCWVLLEWMYGNVDTRRGGNKCPPTRTISGKFSK